MSWLYSAALVEEYLGDISLDGEQSVPSSGNPTQQAYCAPGKMTDFSRLSRFGMTFKPLTENLGEELLMSYREAFLARTSPLLEKEQESMEKPLECGEKWHGSFAKYNPDSCSWKTHQCSLLGDLEEFSETWPQWGLMRNGECWERQMLAQTTKETEFGLLQKWPTPVTRDYKDSGSQEALKRARDKRDSPGLALLVGAEGGGNLNPTWVEWLMGWPLGWTDLKPLEMDKSHFVPQPHGES